MDSGREETEIRMYYLQTKHMPGGKQSVNNNLPMCYAIRIQSTTSTFISKKISHFPKSLTPSHTAPAPLP